MKKTIRVYKKGEDLIKNSYYIAKNGVFETVNNKFFKAIVKSEMKELPEIEPKIKLKIEKIPSDTMSQIVAFFKKVYAEHKAEAIILLYYSLEKKHYVIGVPEQTVSGASAVYDKVPHIKGYRLIGSIHSHGSMSAFHSGVDDTDELDWDGIHITIGTIENPTYSVSMVSNGTRFMMKEEDIMQIEEIKSFPKEWMDQVNKPKPVETTKDSKIDDYYGYGYGYHKRDTENYYDENNWERRYREDLNMSQQEWDDYKKEQGWYNEYN